MSDTFRIELTLEQREAVLSHFGLASDAACVTATLEPTEFLRAERRWQENWGRAEILWREGSTAEAITVARAAVYSFPTAHGHSWLASLLVAVGQPREALVEYQAAIRLSPMGSESYLELGRALARAGVVEDLLAAYGDALGENWQAPPLALPPDPVSRFLDQQPDAKSRSACRRNLDGLLWGVDLSEILEILSVPSDLDELWNLTGTVEGWGRSAGRQCAAVEAFFEFCEEQGYILREEDEETPKP